MRYFYPIAFFLFIPFVLMAKDYRAMDFHLEGVKIQGLYRTEMGLWFSSDKGLFLYDGHKALAVALPSTPGYKIEANIMDIYPASDDALFLLVRNIGLCHYNFRKNTIDIYGFFEEQADPLYGNTITAFHRLSENKLLLGLYRRGLDILDLSTACVEHFDFVLDPDDAMQTLNLNHITDIEADPFSEDVFWLACSWGLMRFNIKTADCLEYIIDHEEDFPKARSVVNLHMDKEEGHLWFGTWGNGLMKMDIQTAEKQAFFPKKIKKLSGFYNVILDLVEMDEDRFWICSNDLGLSYFNKEKGVFTALANNPLHEKVDRVMSPRRMYQDKEGNLWVVYDDKLGYLSAKPEALSKIDMSAHNHRQSIRFQIYAALLKEEEQYYLTYRGEGVLKAEKDTFVYLEHSEKIEGIIDSELIRFHTKGDSTFVFGSSGLYFLDEEAAKLIAVHKHPDGAAYRRSFFDGERHFYFGSRWNGFYKYDLFTGELKNYDIASSYDASYTSDFEMDEQGRLWIAHDGGISHFYPAKDSIANYDISAILEESSSTQRISFLNRRADNKILFGSFEGLFAYADQDSIPYGSYYRLDTLLNKEDRFVRDLYENEQGEYWVLTDNRLLLFDENWRTIAVMDKDDGLQANFEHYRICPLNQDSLLLSGPHAAYFISRTKLLQQRTAPKPRLRSIMLMNSLLYDVTASDKVHSLEFAYDQNFIDLEIVPMGFSAIEKSRLQWRMKGLQDEWRTAYGAQRLSYNSIAPGQYYFQFQTIDQRGEALSPIRELSLLIRPPYWEMWWFRALVFISVVLLSLSIYRVRLRQIREKDKIRADFEKALVEVELKALRAQMNPHFIFNSLNSIKHFLIKSDIEKGVLYLNKFSRLLRMILNHSQQSQVSLEEELNFLRLYLRLEQMRFEQSFEWRIDEPEDIDLSQYSIPTLSIQPLVENAIWHGLLQKRGHRKLDIRLKAERDCFEISILDNGIGREAAAGLRSRSSLKHKSMGLDMVKNRLALFTKGEKEVDYMIIRDLKTEMGAARGTEVLIRLPKLPVQ